MRGLLSALSFLTICPVPAAIHRDRNAMRSAPGWYPVVGLLVGGIAAGAFAGLEFLPPLPRAVIVVALPILLTRALHLDGFADVCDGLGVTGPVAKRLEVMRDPRLGAFGVTGVVLNLLMRVAIVASLPEAGWIAIAAAPAFGRLAILTALRHAGYGGAEFSAVAVRPTLPMVLSALIPFLAAGWIVPSLVLPGLAGTVLLMMLWVAFVRRRFGALTGDALGALNELAELLVLFVFLVSGGQVSGR